MKSNKIEKLVIAHGFICEFCGFFTPCGYVLKTGRDISTVCASCADTFEFANEYVTASGVTDIALGITIGAIANS